MKQYTSETVPQKRARKARNRRKNDWMPAFAASTRAKSGPVQARSILASIACALGKKMGRSRS